MPRPFGFEPYKDADDGADDVLGVWFELHGHAQHHGQLHKEYHKREDASKANDKANNLDLQSFPLRWYSITRPIILRDGSSISMVLKCGFSGLKYQRPPS